MINNSPKTRRALSIVAAKGDQCSPAVFATDMWPDSPGWQKPSKHVRNGVRSGAVMNTAAAAYLGRLRSAGLIEPSGAGYSLTTEGWNLLASGSRVATGGQQAIPPSPSGLRERAVAAAVLGWSRLRALGRGTIPEVGWPTLRFVWVTQS